MSEYYYFAALHFAPDVVTGTGAAQIREINGSRDGDHAGAPPVEMAQLVRDHLEFVRTEPRLVMEDVVVCWTGSSLNKAFTFITRYNNKK